VSTPRNWPVLPVVRADGGCQTPVNAVRAQSAPPALSHRVCQVALTITASTSPLTLAALAAGALALAGCGESAQAKAKTQVCNARADIAKQIDTLSGFTLSSTSVNAANAALQAIGKDLTQIRNAQSKLDPGRRSQVEAASRKFESEVRSIASGLASNLSPSDAAAQFKAALGQLATAYKQALAPINCA